MIDQTSARLALPLLVPGQAEKESTHNEALALLDLAVQTAVVAVGATVPPAAPALGECWAVGAAPTGAWRGQAHRLAGWTAGGWRFLQPGEGFAAWCISTAKPVTYRAGSWVEGELSCDRLTVGGERVVGARTAAIPDPVGGDTIDASGRAAIVAILGAMRQHGLIAR